MEPETAPATPAGPDLDLGYQVELDAFSGPLDLLLHLVRRAEVDITEIAIAQIADQYIAAVGDWAELDLDQAGDFILMAATLLEWKARTVAPPPDKPAGDEDDEDLDLLDPRQDLVAQLLAFRRVKEAVLEIEALEQARALRHQRRFQEIIPEEPDDGEGMDLAKADPYVLLTIWEKVLESVAAAVPRRVLYNDVPMEERLKQLEVLMREAGEARLSWFLEKVTNPVQKCGMVVATLEGIRQRIVEATQHEQFGEVHMRYLPPDERARVAVLPPEVEEVVGRRRRRPPLFTVAVPIANSEDEAPEGLVEEAVVETEEQRYVRELNEKIGIDGLLDRVARLDEHLYAHLRELGIAVPEPEGQAAVAVLPTAQVAASTVPASVPEAHASRSPDGDDEPDLPGEDDDEGEEEDGDDDDDDDDDDDEEEEDEEDEEDEDEDEDDEDDDDDDEEEEDEEDEEDDEDDEDDEEDDEEDD